MVQSFLIHCTLAFKRDIFLNRINKIGCKYTVMLFFLLYCRFYIWTGDHWRVMLRSTDYPFVSLSFLRGMENLWFGRVVFCCYCIFFTSFSWSTIHSWWRKWHSLGKCFACRVRGCIKYSIWNLNFCGWGSILSVSTLSHQWYPLKLA